MDVGSIYGEHAVSARLTTQGSILVYIEDAGTGISVERRQVFAAQFEAALRTNIEPTEQTGLAVVSRLAIKHGIRVTLDTPGNKGTTAVVLLPATLVCDPPATPWFADTPAVRTPPPAPAPVLVGESSPAAGPSPRIACGNGTAPERENNAQRLAPARAAQPARVRVLRHHAAWSPEGSRLRPRRESRAGTDRSRRLLCR